MKKESNAVEDSVITRSEQKSESQDYTVEEKDTTSKSEYENNQHDGRKLIQTSSSLKPGNSSASSKTESLSTKRGSKFTLKKKVYTEFNNTTIPQSQSIMSNIDQSIKNLDTEEYSIVAEDKNISKITNNITSELGNVGHLQTNVQSGPNQITLSRSSKIAREIRTIMAGHELAFKDESTDNIKHADTQKNKVAETGQYTSSQERESESKRSYSESESSDDKVIGGYTPLLQIEDAKRALIDTDVEELDNESGTTGSYEKKDNVINQESSDEIKESENSLVQEDENVTDEEHKGYDEESEEEVESQSTNSNRSGLAAQVDEEYKNSEVEQSSQAKHNSTDENKSASEENESQSDKGEEKSTNSSKSTPTSDKDV